LRRELSQLRPLFGSSTRAGEPDEPPRGLAERTSVWVAESDSYDVLPKRDAAIAQAADPPAGVLGWSLADLTVAGGVMLAVSMLLFPAIRESRDEARRVACQNNQWQIYRVVASFQEDHAGYVPFVQPNDIAGIFTVQLVELRYISREDLAPLLVCPDAPVADAIRARQFVVNIPTLEALSRMSAEERAEAGAKMSPTYAYGFGYRNDQQYFYIRGRGPIPFLGDEPGEAKDDYMSPNHGGSIVQYAMLDGSVKTRTSTKVQGDKDHLYENALRERAAGLGRLDTVLGLSEATPAVFINDELQR
jgi:prepilin-type processing-associated H-X9-DG protein